ncbi:MAG: prolyl oligopeptidase family serine peptidase, partial [bacterium]
MLKKAIFTLLALSFLSSISVSAQSQFLPGIEDTLVIKDWLYVGPFSVGAREGIVGVIEDIKNFRPYEGLEHPSILAQGGRVKWKRTTLDSLGWINLEYEDVLWDTLMDIWGIAGLVDAGYAYAEFESKGRRRALVVARKPGSFFINGRRYYGNPYGDRYMRTPVLLEEGTNRVLVSVGGYADHRFEFKLLPPPAPVVVVTADATVPDIIEGEMLKGWAGITLMNTTNRRLDDVRITLGGGSAFRQAHKTISHLDPLIYKKVPLELEQIEPVSPSDTVWVPVGVSSAALLARDSLRLRVRKKDESFLKTFLSDIDSSCQYYAVLPPKEYSPQEKYGLILTLHGAGVRASGQVKSYQPKDWAFIVAPTNRRRFGFDWQDWGRLDALEVLELARKSFPIDTNRVYLVGHSMGGHGAWHVGLAHPDLFAAMAPAAGWTCFQMYVPWFLQKSYMFAEPRQIGIRDMSLREDFTPNFVENALNLPVFILHGGIDDNVPTVHGRMFARILDQLGYEYVYKEVPGKKHWWKSGDLQCVDDTDLMRFLKDRRRNPYPRRVVFKTTNTGQTGKSYWIQIDEQERPFFESRIEAEVAGSSMAINTSNVRQFTLFLDEALIPFGKFSMTINGHRISERFQKNGKYSFHKKGERFVNGVLKHKGLTKRPDLHGPIKQAYFSPFVLVYGTKGDSAATELLYRQACWEGMRWWHRANGYVDVLPDTEVTDVVVKNRNL